MPMSAMYVFQLASQSTVVNMENQVFADTYFKIQLRSPMDTNVILVVLI
jgi:hypothetical protein